MLLRNATILILSPPCLEPMDLRVNNDSITAASRGLQGDKNEEVVDLSGKLIMPGMVNAHTHLYSALARGMAAPKESPTDFVDMLKKIWWKLDEALDEESIYYSALVGSIDAAKNGTTLLVDHHASPNCIAGSLDIIKEGMSAVGLRGVLCYETTDRGGRKRRDDGLRENERFARDSVNNSRFRGTVGAHASFTLNDDTMKALGELGNSLDCGVHIHVAEDKADVLDSTKNRGLDLAVRLQKYGILTDKSILAHGAHLSENQLALINRSGAWLVHNPRSNMNNAVGPAPLQWFGPRSALGTDGFPADMFEECRLGFFRNQESANKVGFSRLPEMLCAGQDLASKVFGIPFGTLGVGSPADLIVLDYVPPTPLGESNVIAHFLFGMNAGMVAHTMVNGRWIMFNRELVGIDQEKVMNEATKAAQKLWERMQKD